MNTVMLRALFVATSACLALSTTSCNTDKHRMRTRSTGTTINCRECYDEVRVIRHGGRMPYERTVYLHKCSGCKSDMSIYMENETMMVKCKGCAPEGMPCDQCLPPDADAK